MGPLPTPQAMTPQSTTTAHTRAAPQATDLWEQQAMQSVSTMGSQPEGQRWLVASWIRALQRDERFPARLPAPRTVTGRTVIAAVPGMTGFTPEMRGRTEDGPWQLLWESGELRALVPRADLMALWWRAQQGHHAPLPAQGVRDLTLRRLRELDQSGMSPEQLLKAVSEGNLDTGRLRRGLEEIAQVQPLGHSAQQLLGRLLAFEASGRSGARWTLPGEPWDFRQIEAWEAAQHAAHPGSRRAPRQQTVIEIRQGTDETQAEAHPETQPEIQVKPAARPAEPREPVEAAHTEQSGPSEVAGEAGTYQRAALWTLLRALERSRLTDGRRVLHVPSDVPSDAGSPDMEALQRDAQTPLSLRLARSPEEAQMQRLILGGLEAWQDAGQAIPEVWMHTWDPRVLEYAQALKGSLRVEVSLADPPADIPLHTRLALASALRQCGVSVSVSVPASHADALGDLAARATQPPLDVRITGQTQ